MTDEVKAFPEYPSKHTGVALVVGSGPDALKEVHLAIQRLPVAPYVIAVNAMASLVPCQAMVMAETNLDLCLKALPAGWQKPITHHYPSGQREYTRKVPGFDFIWSAPPAASGTSSLCAVIIAKAIGLSEIILCGIPLAKTGYIEGYPVTGLREFGTSGKIINGTVQQRRETWGKFYKAGMLEGVTSFSGFTRELLGEPRFQKEIV